VDHNLPITIQEALRQFLEEEDEAVARPRFERIAAALSRFVGHQSEHGVPDVSSLTLDQVEEFLETAAPGGQPTPRDTSDTWYSVKRFLKWLKRKKYSGVYDEFSREQGRLREELRTRANGSPRDG